MSNHKCFSCKLKKKNLDTPWRHEDKRRKWGFRFWRSSERSHANEIWGFGFQGYCKQQQYESWIKTRATFDKLKEYEMLQESKFYNLHWSLIGRVSVDFHPPFVNYNDSQDFMFESILSHKISAGILFFGCNSAKYTVDSITKIIDYNEIWEMRVYKLRNVLLMIFS